MKTKKPETQARPWPEGFLLFYYWKRSNFLHKLWPIHKLPSKPGTYAFPETQGPQGDLSGPGSGQWSMGNVSFWTSICINLWLTPTNTILGVHSSSWVNMACINQHPINTESSLYRGNLGTLNWNSEARDRTHRVREFHRCSQKQSCAACWRQDRGSSSMSQSSFWSPRSACGWDRKWADGWSIHTTVPWVPLRTVII